MGEKSYRAKQIFSWLHERGAVSFEDMTDISKELRRRLKEEFALGSLSVNTVQVSKLDGTRKYLFSMEDRALIEGVRMEYRDCT